MHRERRQLLTESGREWLKKVSPATFPSAWHFSNSDSFLWVNRRLLVKKKIIPEKENPSTSYQSLSLPGGQVLTYASL